MSNEYILQFQSSALEKSIIGLAKCWNSIRPTYRWNPNGWGFAGLL